MNIRKLIRTAQNHFPSLKHLKDASVRIARRTFRTPHERDFQLIRQLTGNNHVFVDVGANYGQTIESILIYSPHAHIYSFEANPILAAELARRYARRGNVKIFAEGLGAENAQLTLYIPSYNGFVYDGLASLSREEARNWLGPDRIYGFNESRLQIAEVLCQIRTLDSYALQPTFIKIDVQGTEYNVLLGAEQTINLHKPILLIEDYEGDPRMAKFLEPKGYRAFHLAKDGSIAPGRGDLNTILVTDSRLEMILKKSGSA
jgi:FkbM family methyltransferase